MTDPQLRTQTDAAAAYEELLVTALFGRWAPIVAEVARIEPEQRVLDVACGTGVLARRIKSIAGSENRIAGVDPNAGMLEVARRLAPAVDWRQGTAESLPFPDRSFDTVVSQFGMMFFRDRAAAIREMLRVLAPGGRIVVAVWGALADNPAYAAEVELLDRMAGTVAGDALRLPFALGDARSLARSFSEGDVEDLQVTERTSTAEFPSVRIMVEADLRGWLPVMGVVLNEERIASILEQAEMALERWVTPRGSVAFETHALVVTGISGGAR